MAKSTLTKEQFEILKETLLKEEKSLRETMTYLKSTDPFKDPEHANDNAAIDTDVREQVDHDTIEAEVKSLEKKLNLVVLALQKMEKGTYGICEKTKKPIPFERLSIVPEAQYTIEYERQKTR